MTLNKLRQSEFSSYYYKRFKDFGVSDEDINIITMNGLLVNLKNSKTYEIRQFNWSNRKKILQRKHTKEWFEENLEYIEVEYLIDENKEHLVIEFLKDMEV